ncbi:unnamed protein product [Medioppia subpectinata]|uniref:Uncharacterized protein n=1 Tax=Medioppia subpectinata TaxID=1979941 RepID=A0A7R9Q1W3_9ACAR|nr:unnamed protein product [Medioppia subpectinata]CAG2109493.1 unnamed protein product [Medioppia subpectinata]
MSAFQTICENDQIALIKYSSIEALLMRTALYFDYDQEFWTFIHDTKGGIKCKLDLLKDLHNLNGIDGYNCYYEKFPDRPNLIHKEMVKLQQQLYMYLLKRYFHMKYGSSCAAQERFLRIINSLEELSKFVTIHREAHRRDHNTQIGPLLREVLDLPALDNCPNNNDYTVL